MGANTNVQSIAEREKDVEGSDKIVSLQVIHLSRKINQEFIDTVLELIRI